LRIALQKIPEILLITYFANCSIICLCMQVLGPLIKYVVTVFILSSVKIGLQKYHPKIHIFNQLYIASPPHACIFAINVRVWKGFEKGKVYFNWMVPPYHGLLSYLFWLEHILRLFFYALNKNKSCMLQSQSVCPNWAF
jgi:hypothetical protein